MKTIKTPKHVRKMLKDAKKKYLLPSLNALNKLANEATYTMRLTYEPALSNKKKKHSNVTAVCDVQIKKNKNELGFKFTSVPRKFMDVGGIKYPESYGLDDKLIVRNISNGKKYFIDKNSVIDFTTRYNKKKQYLVGYFTNISSFDILINCTAYWRLIVPISEVTESDKKFPAEIIDHKKNHLVFDNPIWDMQKTLLGIRMPTTMGMFSRVKVNGNQFDFYTMDDLDVLIIDSCNKISHTEFRNICGIIRSAFGFLCGKCYRDEAYYVSSQDTNFRKIENVAFEKETPSIISQREIVNPHMFFDHFRSQNKNYQTEYSKYHNLFSEEVFSKLCSEMYKNETFHRTIELILSAVSSESPITQGALYSVAIETMTNIIKDENPKSIKIINDRDLAKKLRKELLKVLNINSTEITLNSIANGITILQNKINQINDVPNSKKLTIPFDLYEISLDADDISAIKKRNDFLHGNSPIDPKEKFALELIGLKLHFLIGCLILKYVGYEGHVMNLPVWHYFGNKEELNKLTEAMNTENLTPLSEIKKMQEKGEINEAKQKLEKLLKAIHAGKTLADAIKII